MRCCKVFVNDIEAGLLVETDPPREYVFRYKADYLTKGLPPVSLLLPLRAEEYRSPHLFPYFFNMLSEGENREIQSAFHQIPKEDDFGILLATAQNDTPGAVTVLPIED